MARSWNPNNFIGLVPIALVLLALLLSIVPFVAQDVSTEEFEAECQQLLQNYLYEQGRVDRGEKQPEDRLDDAINNFLGHGCTWNMFDEPTATATAAAPVATTAAPLAPIATTAAPLTPLVPTAMPTLDPTATFLAECQDRLQTYLYEQGRVDRGERRPEDRLDDAINNFLGHGCTWNMFDEPTPTMTAAAPVATTAAPLAPIATIAATVTPLAPTATPTLDPTATFLAECQQLMQNYIYEQGRVDRGERQPEDRLDDAINNFLGHGCTWDMFE